LVRAASVASKASDFILAFQSGTLKFVGNYDTNDDQETS
jgi:hypothetical protein